MKYSEIFLAFFRVGILGFGGGPACLPLVQREVVDKYQGLTKEEFGDVVAIANSLPGPINTKLAGYIGHRHGGILGCLLALTGTVLPSVLMLIILLGALANFSEIAWVQGMVRAIVPVITVMLGVMAWQFLQGAAKGMTWGVSLFLVILTATLVQLLSVHPALIIFLLLLWALFGHHFTLDISKIRRKEANK